MQNLATGGVAPPREAPAPAGVKEHPWTTQAPADEAKRKRINDINAVLKCLGSAELDQTVHAKFVAERDDLQAQLQAAKPLEANVTSVSNQLKAARSKQAACKAKCDAAEEALQKAKAALDQALSEEVAASQHIIELEARMRNIVGKVTPVTTGGAPSLEAFIPGMETTISQFEKLVQQLGGGDRFAADLAAMAAAMGKLKQVAADAEPPPRPPEPEAPQAEEGGGGMQVDAETEAADEAKTYQNVDGLDAATCREHLKSCGINHPVPTEGEDDPVPLREELKRHLSLVSGLRKRIKTEA